jgi:TPR repeat protein
MRLFCTIICFLSLAASAPVHGQSSMAQDAEFQKMLKQAAKGKSTAVASVISFSRMEELRPYCEAALSEACRQGTTEACDHMAIAVFARNGDSAIAFYKRCVDAGDQRSAVCALNIASIYYSGEPRYWTGTPKQNMINMAQAKVWFEKTLAMGYKDEGGAYSVHTLLDRTNNALAHQYTNGAEAYKAGNMVEAYRLWKLDAEAWLFSGTKALATPRQLDALNGLGLLYRSGQGVPKDLYEAAVWYGRAGDAGETDAYIRAGNTFCLVSNGEYVRAIEMYKKAVDNGNEQARPLMVAAQQALDERVRGVMAERAAAAKAIEEQYRKWESTPHNTAVGTSKPQTTQWGTPDKTATQRDQEMYDKMHREADQREKAYNDKWGR